MKRIKLQTGLKYLKWTLGGFFILIIGYFAAAILGSLISTNPGKYECHDSEEVYLLSNGIHLEVAISKKLLTIEFQEELQLIESTSFVSFGWGEKQFYLETPTWDELKMKTALKALFLKSPSAMHITRFENNSNQWQEMQICEIQLDLLINYLSNSFKRDSKGNLIKIVGAGYNSNDFFYEAKGHYHCFQTCNNWVNRGLKEAKIKTSIWSPFERGTLYQIKKNSENKIN